MVDFVATLLKFHVVTHAFEKFYISLKCKSEFRILHVQFIGGHALWG